MLAILLILALSGVSQGLPTSNQVAKSLMAAFPPTPSSVSLRGKTTDPLPLNCSTCELVMEVYTEIAGNATTLKEFVDLFEDACSVIGPGTPIGAICDAIISGALEAILPFLYQQLTTLAWDIPETFCSVFIPVCTVDCCDTPTTPEQLRLAFTNDEAAWSIQWTTLQLVADAEVSWSVYGSTGTPSTAPAVPRTYTLGGWRGTLYSSTMGGLLPGTTYSYKVGSDAGGWSALYNFTTLPSNIGSAGRPLRLGHLGDMGWGNNSNGTIAALIKLVESGGVDAIVHTGDVSYADGQQKSWDVYGRKIHDITSRIPYMVGVGNHEQVWWGGAPYRARWTMPPALNPITRTPLPATTTANRSFYSLDIAQVLHFAMIDTESVLDVSDVSTANQDWLKQDLGLAKLGSKWVLAGGHRPLYCTNGGYKSSNKDCSGMAATLRGQVEATLQGVDLVLGAHMHGYERTLPVKDGIVVANGTAPVYIVNGAGGNREGNDDPKGDAPWSAPGAHSGVFGYGLMTFVSGPPGASTMEYQFIESATGNTLDSVTLTK